MIAMASQITGVSIACWTICSVASQRKHQTSESLDFVMGIHPSQKASNAEIVSIWWRHHPQLPAALSMWKNGRKCKHVFIFFPRRFQPITGATCFIQLSHSKILHLNTFRATLYWHFTFVYAYCVDTFSLLMKCAFFCLGGAKPLSEPMLKYIVDWTLTNKFQWDLIGVQTFSFNKMHLENVVCEIVSILSRPQCVNAFSVFQPAPHLSRPPFKPIVAIITARGSTRRVSLPQNTYRLSINRQQSILQ